MTCIFSRILLHFQYVYVSTCMALPMPLNNSTTFWVPGSLTASPGNQGPSPLVSVSSQYPAYKIYSIHVRWMNKGQLAP